jgi:hypothetical protein
MSDRLMRDEVCTWPVETDAPAPRADAGEPWMECGVPATEVLMGWDHGEWFELALCDTHAAVYRTEGIEEVAPES